MLKLVWHDGERAFAIHRGKNILLNFDGQILFPTMREVDEILMRNGLALTRHDNIISKQ